MYMTPERFRTFGTGVDLDEIEDVALRSHLTTASSMVDAYCTIPMLPQRHDFRGGTITDEEHQWNLGDRRVDWGTQRLFPHHGPVREVTQFRIVATNNQYVEISPDDLIINNISGWVEVVSLAVSQVGLFGFGIIPILGLSVPLAKLSYRYGWEFVVTSEFLEPTDARTYRAQNQFWVVDSLTVYVNGAEADPGDYTVELTEGTVEFTDQLTDGDLVTADYSYTLPAEIAQATGLIATSLLDEQDLRAKGMGRLEAVQVEEVSLRRTVPQRASQIKHSIPEAAEQLLEPFVFRTVRG